MTLISGASRQSRLMFCSTLDLLLVSLTSSKPSISRKIRPPRNGAWNSAAVSITLFAFSNSIMPGALRFSTGKSRNSMRIGSVSEICGSDVPSSRASLRIHEVFPDPGYPTITTRAWSCSPSQVTVLLWSTHSNRGGMKVSLRETWVSGINPSEVRHLPTSRLM